MSWFLFDETLFVFISIENKELVCSKLPGKDEIKLSCLRRRANKQNL